MGAKSHPSASGQVAPPLRREVKPRVGGSRPQKCTPGAVSVPRARQGIILSVLLSLRVAFAPAQTSHGIRLRDPMVFRFSWLYDRPRLRPLTVRLPGGRVSAKKYHSRNAANDPVDRQQASSPLTPAEYAEPSGPPVETRTVAMRTRARDYFFIC